MHDEIKRIFLRRLEDSAETSRPPGVIHYEVNRPGIAGE